MVRLISVITAAWLLAGSTAPVLAQQQAGVSAAVRGQVQLARLSQAIVGRKVKSGDPIFLGDAITSGQDSGLQIMLMDETVFTIGPNSEISIDQFIYNPETSSGKVVASIAKGMFRFITGKIAQRRPEDMTVRLPTAILGIRGTIVAGAVRSAAGVDARVDQVFDGLKGIIPDVQSARDFAVLLGPGDENNTNDKGGAFVLRPRGGQNADQGVTVSRTNHAVISDAAGKFFGPFAAPRSASQIVTGSLTAGKVASRRTASSGEEARRATNANGLSQNDLAEAAGVAVTQNILASSANQSGEVTDPAASSIGLGGFGQTTLADLVAIPTGIFRYTIPLTNITGAANGSYSGQIDIQFASQTVNFNISGNYAGSVNDTFAFSTLDTFVEATEFGVLGGTANSITDAVDFSPGPVNSTVILNANFLNESGSTAQTLLHSVQVLAGPTLQGPLQGAGAGVVTKQVLP